MERVELQLAELTWLVGGGEVAVLSGAGISTESGIPDYRGPTGAARRFAPMTYQTFSRDPAARRRYWARSYLGWRTIARATPNAGHHAVAELQRAGLVRGIVTQNVDGLHQAGGASGVIELHGSLDMVICLDCGQRSPRERLDSRLRAANGGFVPTTMTVNPDGDAELDEAAVTGFQVVACESCAGVLKPDVVFFGENVPVDRVRAAFEVVEGARALLVLGSSLTVMSGRRFVLRASRLGIPVAIVNQGSTRGDTHAQLAIDAPLGQLLPRLAARLGRPVVPAGYPSPASRAARA
ncbi:MAG: NAD-dependent protein deacetylase [Micromonosporaceae bacterium]|nr:NAD-dependent protein deacetylase [Micromonosporaceae bacterium]